MLFEIQNFTHYNTEDIEALLIAIETAREDLGLPVRKASTWKGGEKVPLDSAVILKDYQPSASHKDGGRQYVKRQPRRWTWDGLWSSVASATPAYRAAGANTIRIVPSRKLALNPLEQLAGCGAGSQPVLPEEAQAQLCEALGGLYSYLSYKNKPEVRERALRLAPRIRIETERQAVAGQEEKIRAARVRAGKAWAGALRAARKAAEHIYRMEQKSGSAERQLKRSKVLLVPEEEAVLEAVRQLRSALNDVETTLAALDG